MKILVVTNLYPPHHIGGYELGCRDVVEQLRARGHRVQVLTSDYRHPGSENVPGEEQVERVLQYNVGAAARPHDKRAEIGKLTRSIRQFAPAVVYFWNQSGLSYWLPLTAHWQGCSVAFFLSDTGFVSWRIAAWLVNAARRHPLIPAYFGKSFLVCGWSIIENRTCHFASEFLRAVAVQQGIQMAPRSSVVAHWGIDPVAFAPVVHDRWPLRRLLYVGQMIEVKGVHTAIAALARLAGEAGGADFTLTLAGSGMDPKYEQKLRAQAAQLGVAGRVTFLGRVPRTELAGVYATHDVLIFPSEWEEPFAITPLEAIHSGLAVVGTTTGGSGELFRNRETAMTFAAGDAADGARAIRELCADRRLYDTICRQSQQVVRDRHTLQAMVDVIEESLCGIV